MAVDTNYVTLPELKAWKTVKPSTVDRDDMMLKAIAAASRAIDACCGRRFYLDETASPRTYSARNTMVSTVDGGLLLIDDIGDTADLLVEQGGPTAWSDISSSIELWPPNAVADRLAVEGLLYPFGYPGSWLLGPYSRVRVTARWGWPQVPDDVAQACLIKAAGLYSRRNSPEGVLGVAEWGAVRVTRADPDVLDLLSPYRRVRVG